MIIFFKTFLVYIFLLRSCQNFLLRRNRLPKALHPNYKPHTTKNLLLSHTSSVIEKTWDKIRNVLHLKEVDSNPPLNAKDLSIWQACGLEQIRELGPLYELLTFKLNSRIQFDLDIGQEIQVCFLDGEGNTLAGYLFPVNINENKNEFSCIVKSLSMTTDRFQNGLCSLSFGDEIAIKKGRRHLSQGAKLCDPIQSITIAATSSGLPPALQMMQYFADNGSIVEEVDFIWVNKDTDEFILDEEIQQISESSRGKFNVHRFLIAAMDDPEVFDSDQFTSAIKPYKYGKVVILCGPTKFLEAMTTTFSLSGYYRDNILQIETK